MTDTTASVSPSVTWPPNDPATWRNLPASSTPVSADRVASLLAAEWERFEATTPASAAHHARALSPLPMGVPSSFQHWDPYPVAITSANGAWLTDVDGRKVLDLSMGFGAMLVGHLNPAVVAAVGRALETGTLFVTPSPSATDAAERFQRRFSLDQLRFANSGTEATNGQEVLDLSTERHDSSPRAAAPRRLPRHRPPDRADTRPARSRAALSGR